MFHMYHLDATYFAICININLLQIEWYVFNFKNFFSIMFIYFVTSSNFSTLGEQHPRITNH